MSRVGVTACRNVLGVLLLVALTLIPPAQAAAALVSPTEGRFYGRIEGVEVPPHALLEEAPVIAFRPQGPNEKVQQRTVLLHVPHGEIENWPRHCAKYEACSVPVNFVAETWFQQTFLTQENSQGEGAQSYLIELARDSQDARAQNHRHSKAEQ
jgi:hypothetical protein